MLHSHVFRKGVTARRTVTRKVGADNIEFALIPEHDEGTSVAAMR